MKHSYVLKLLWCVLLTLSVSTYAQLNTPRGSQHATVSQRIGVSDVSISYARPSVNNRVIWGNLVPYGLNNLGFGTSTAAPWRAGADENTTITFTHDAQVNGKALAAGTYGFHIIVHDESTATLIFSKDTQHWGSFFYEPSHDALRVAIATQTVPHREQLTYEFVDVKPNSATAQLVWEKRAFPFTVSFDVTTLVLNDFKEQSKGQTGFQRQNWEQAAAYALNNGGDLNEALAWIDGAIAGNFYSQKTFNNLAIKAQILNKMGDKTAYATIMDEAAGLANANQLNNLGYQMLGTKDFTRALTYFENAAKLDPNNPNVYDSLGECYKTMGDKKNAIKYFKKSLSMNPPPNVKANSEKHLKDLGAL